MREIRSDDRKNLLTERLMKHWNALPRQVMKFPSLEVTEKQVGQEPVGNDIEISDLLLGHRKGRDGLLRTPPGLLLLVISKFVIQI